MKLLWIFLLIGFNTFGQTNYNTILNTKYDSLPPIDLHYKRSQQLSTAATLLHAAATVSLAAMYFIKPNPKGFIIPGSFVVCSVTLHILSSNEFKKSKNYLETE